MALNSINTNIAAYSAQGNIGRASEMAGNSIARLSSGNRIVKASDDVAALASGTSLRTQVSTLRTALLNASQGTSLLQVADGALAQISDILQRQKSIAIQAGSGSLTDADRAFLDQEFQGLAAQIDQIASATNFNGVTLLNGGLGTKARLANTDALAILMTPGTATGSTAGTSATSVKAINAFNRDTGAERDGTAAAGELQLVDSGGTALSNGSFDSVNKALYGQFTNFRASETVYTVSTQISADINGVTFSGTYATGTTVTLNNGNTYVKLKFNTAITLTNAGTVEAGITALADDFEDTTIMHTQVLQGVNFAGTRLAGVTGATTYGPAMVRLSDATRVDISNFRYAGNDAAADTNRIQVTINGKTFTANGVLDATAAATPTIIFEDGGGQVLQLNLTGLNTDFTDIRTDLVQQRDFINALNVGFSRAGSGLNFAIGSTSSDSVRVQLNSVSTTALYNGQTLSVGSATDAAIAATAVDNAIKIATSARANVGALQSRFGFASANIQASLQNQDAARGTLLDTDVTAESTAYATAQVQLQAGIAVLAQANLLPQNLLKLIQ